MFTKSSRNFKMNNIVYWQHRLQKLLIQTWGGEAWEIRVKRERCSLGQPGPWIDLNEYLLFSWGLMAEANVLEWSRGLAVSLQQVKGNYRKRISPNKWDRVLPHASVTSSDFLPRISFWFFSFLSVLKISIQA